MLLCAICVLAHGHGAQEKYYMSVGSCMFECPAHRIFDIEGLSAKEM